MSVENIKLSIQRIPGGQIFELLYRVISFIAMKNNCQRLKPIYLKKILFVPILKIILEFIKINFFPPKLSDIFLGSLDVSLISTAHLSTSMVYKGN